MSSTTALLGTNLVDAVSFDEESTTALYTACALGQAAAVDVLAQLGADLHIPDAAGRLPMYAATNRGHNEGRGGTTARGEVQGRHAPRRASDRVNDDGAGSCS